MRFLVDACYAIAALVTAPLWVARWWRGGKLATDWAGRFGSCAVPARQGGSRVLIYAVSVGEVNAARLLVRRLAAEGIDVVVAAATDTGFARAVALYGAEHGVVRYPFDFSFAVSRFLNTVQPDVVALMELEVWPNFTAECRRRGIVVCVVNGRMTARAARRYRRIAPLVRPSFGRLSFAAVQNDDYADRFRRAGVRERDVLLTGTMKWDTAEITDEAEGADALASAMGIDRGRPLVVGGSTAPGEHELLVAALPEGVQLLCAPRKPEWFDGAAIALPGCVRRSRGERWSSTGRYLLDTIGELRRAYALADVVVVGRSFVDLEGSDMMEPAALGKAVVVGPNTSAFADTVTALVEGGGLIVCRADELKATLAALLADPQRRAAIAARARDVIRAHQGATERTAGLLMGLLAEARGVPAASGLLTSDSRPPTQDRAHA